MAEDYKTLIKTLRRKAGFFEHSVGGNGTYLAMSKAADAVESLLAENERLRTAENLLAMDALSMSQATAMSLDQASAFIEGVYRQATDQRKQLAIRAERDALQAKLDAMTVERVQANYTDWKVVVRKPGNDTWVSTGTIRNDEPFARERLRLHADMGTQPILYKRSVRVVEGPWTVVEGEQSNDNE